MDQDEQLGIYLSIPFCRAKCSFCNFASDVFAPARMDGYVDRLCEEIASAPAYAARLGLVLPDSVDSIYFGGGTPSLLEPAMVARIFAAMRRRFTLLPGAEITVECAPGQFTEAALAGFQSEGMNRVSLGVQSFIDRESAAVGRLHTADQCHAEIRRLHAAGVERLGIDLIAGLPHQTLPGWRHSIEQALLSGVEHVSVYMLEVDEGSRLGRESLLGGRRYGAADLPEDDQVAEWYNLACEWLDGAGIGQYEISNFGRPSRHNMKYWTRQPYLGFGLDAHSMLRRGTGAVRWANASEIGEYVGLPRSGFSRTVDRIEQAESFEEAMFLGLRLRDGVDLDGLRAEFGSLVDTVSEALADVEEAYLVERQGSRVRLTSRGRTVSNEVFGRLLVVPA